MPDTTECRGGAAEQKETLRLFDQDAYAVRFDAVVLDVRPGKRPGTVNVVLDRTLFFPEEGGQTPDMGTLAGFPVIDVQIDRAQVITHTLAITDGCAYGQERSGAGSGLPRNSSVCTDTPGQSVPLEDNLSAGCGSGGAAAAESACAVAPGQSVQGEIDWSHRYSNMQNHSGEHILSGLLHSMYGYENVGFRLSDNTVTLDTSGHLTPEQLRELETKANEAVWRNVPITCEYPPPEVLASLEYRSKKEIEGAVRIVTIEGVDVCACCAPHVRRTGEIGLIKILSAIRSRGGSTRITLVCGQRALLQIQHAQEQLEEASHLMNEPQEMVAEGVKRLQGEIAALKESCRAKELQIVDAEVERIHAAAPPEEEISGKGCYVFEGELSVLSQRAFMNRLCDMGWKYAGVLCGSETDGWKYLIGSRNADARIPNKVLKDRFGARGGGKPDMVQGTVHAVREEIRIALEE